MAKLWSKSRQFIDLMILSLPWIFTSAAFALEVPKVLFDSGLSSPVIKAPSCPDKTEKFFIHGKVNVEKLADYGSTTVWVSDDAQKKCNVRAVDVSNQLRMKSDGFESLLHGLKRLKVDAQEILEKLNVKIVIDDLSKSPSRIFRFYNHDDKIIYLDCSLIEQNYLYPSIAHEITHAVLDNHTLEFWFEESISQLMENEYGGWVPRQSLIQLSQSPMLPALFVTDSEFGHWRDYAMSYLFSTYLSGYFGSWDIFRGILENLAAIKTNSCQEFREALFSAGQSYLKKSGADDSVVQRFTFAGLLRYFAVATHINSPAYSFFRIPGWQAPKESMLPNSKTFKIRAHQFLRLAGTTPIDKFSPELEIYLIQSSKGNYKITDRKQLLELANNRQPLPTSDDKETPQFLLVINAKDKDVQLFK